MDSMRSLNTSLPAGGSAGQKQAAPNDTTEPIVDVFRAAALSITKLYKTAAANQSKARLDGYQDCLDDLLAFLDRENIGVDDGEGWRIRQWATERLDDRESPSQPPESEDEAEKAETSSSTPELTRSTSTTQMQTLREEPTQSRTGSAPPPPTRPATVTEPTTISVPTQDAFTFQSSVPYPPQDTYMNLARLDLSDSRSDQTLPSNAPATTTRTTRSRHSGPGHRIPSRQSNHLGRGAGSKRKINVDEMFDLGSFGYDKNMFGGGGKKSRHT